MRFGEAMTDVERLTDSGSVGVISTAPTPTTTHPFEEGHVMAESDPTLFDWVEQQQPEVEYRDVSDFPDFRVGTDGSVWTRRPSRGCKKLDHTWRLLKQWQDPKRGYCTVTLCKNGRYQRFMVHRLVMLIFVGPRPKGLVVCHFDGDPANNRLSNLRYGTQKDNEADKERHGRLIRGERHHNARLTADDVYQIRELLKDEVPRKEIAARFGISQKHLSSIVVGRKWGWLE
jgi:hypothetical protein